MNQSPIAPAAEILDRKGSSFPLRIGFWVCIVIGVAVVLRRVFALARPSISGPPELAGLDQVFATHASLTLAHILPAMLFVLIIPFYFFGSTKTAARARRLIFPIGATVGITAYAMSVYSVGGWVERSAVLVFNTLFLVSLTRAYLYTRRGEAIQERRWLLRAVVILLGVATTRPVMGVFFATARLTHLVPAQFFGIAFWIGFSLNTAVVELWLRRNSTSPLAHQ
jgi:hypothetical protein